MTDLATAQRLATAPLSVLGAYGHASNTTMLVQLTDRMDAPGVRGSDREFVLDHDVLGRIGSQHLAVWKPVAGQRPLWDFEAASLPHREVAAGVVDHLLGTDLVPPTVWRLDGPWGPGSLQAHVPHDPAMHLLSWVESDEYDPGALARLVVFDLVVNNTDRKASHVLFGEGRFWAIDHGLTFHVDDKVRTVAWQLQGQPVPDELRVAAGDVARHLAEKSVPVTEHLHSDEVIATIQRARRVADSETFPVLDDRSQLPWPLV